MEETPVPPAPPPEGAPSGRPALSIAIASVLTVLVLYFLVGMTLGGLNVAFTLWFNAIFVFVGVPWVIIRFTGHSPVAYVRLQRPTWSLGLFGFGVGLANYFAFVIPIQLAADALTPESWKFVDMSQLFRGQTHAELALVVLAVSAVVPVCEEFLFRGVLQQGLMSPTFPPSRAILLTAIFFSALHLDPVGFFARVELGVLFGVLLLRTGSLWPAIGAHAANNLIGAVGFLTLVTHGDATSMPEQAPSLPSVVGLSALGIAALFGLLRAARNVPGLWERAQQAEPGPLEASAGSPPPALARLLLPWVLAATAALCALAFLDARGLELQRVDQRMPLAPLREGAPDAAQAERTALEQLRARVRRGEAPLSEYREERARLRVREQAQKR